MNDSVEVTNEAGNVDPLQEAFEGWIAAEMNEDDIIEELHSEHELSYPAAVNKLRALKKAAGLTKPRGYSSDEVREFINECHEAGDDRATIISKLVEKFDYTKNSAASTFSVQGGKLGITGGGGFGGGQKKPLDEVVAFARTNADLKRADFCAKMAEELGYTESTAGAFYTYLGFAQEYAKQEVAAVS